MCATGRTRGLLLTTFERAPFWIDGPYDLSRRHVMPLLRSRQPLRRLVGVARDGRTGTVLVVGDRSYLDDLARGFFAIPPVETSVGTMPGFGLARGLAALARDHDLVLARAYSMFARGAEGAGLLRLPDMPDLRLRVGPLEAMLAAANRRTRGMVRQCAEAGYQVRLGCDPERFACFYDDHYLPFARQRHGAGAIVHPPQILRRRLRRGGISWVELDGEPLFAAAFEIVGDTFRELVSGTPHGRYDAPARRAQYVSRAQHMRLAHEAGVRWLTMGGARPWLSDGVLAFKRHWGGELAERPDGLRDLLVGWRRCTPAVAAFLAAHPLVVRRNGGFCAVTAAPPAGPADPNAALASCRPHAPRGIRNLYVVSESGLAWTGLAKGGAHRDVRLQGQASSEELQRVMGDTEGVQCR